MHICERGYIDMGNGFFNDILCVPLLSTNLLYIYQIIDNGVGKGVEFTKNYVALNIFRVEIFSS